MAYEILTKDKNPIEYSGTKLMASDVTGIVKSVDLKLRQLRITGTTETRDRDKDILTFKGWDFTNYLKNPVFLWAHNYSSVPLARSLKIIQNRAKKAYDFQLQFPTKGIHPFADMILELYDSLTINASSVGFLPKTKKPLEEEEIDLDKGEEKVDSWWKGYKYIKKELLELSGCAVPSNPDAIQNSIGEKNYSGIKGLDLIKLMTEGQIDPLERKDDILTELGIREVEIMSEKKKTIIPVKCELEDETESKIEDQKIEKNTDIDTFLLSLSEEVKKNIYESIREKAEDKLDEVVQVNKKLQKDWSYVDKRINAFFDLTAKEFIDINIEKINDILIVKAGAVLSSANKTKLQSAIDNIQSVLESAKPNEPDDDKSKNVVSQDKDLSIDPDDDDMYDDIFDSKKGKNENLPEVKINKEELNVKKTLETLIESAKTLKNMADETMSRIKE